MSAPHDVAIIGAGHNGLVAANYLAEAGLSVIVLEARPVVGGACVTEELIPGSKWSSCAFIAGLLRPEILAHLNLENFGLRLYQSDVLGFSLFDDRSHMFFWKEIDRTLREIEQYSKRDAKRFLTFGLRVRRFAEIVSPWLLQPPPRRSELMRAFEEAGEEQLFNEFVLLSTRDLLDKYFESEHLKGFLTFFGMVSIYGGPSTPGTAYTYGHHAWGDFKGQFGQFGFAEGGMGSITNAMAARARSLGAEIRTQSPVASVLVRDGQAKGVVLRDGEEIRARVVVSNADPKRSLLKLVDAKHLDAAFVEDVARIDQRGSMARIHLLIDELPTYLGFRDAKEGPQHRGHQMLGASVANFEKAWDAERNGVFPDDYVIEAVIQSTTDPTLAPKGRHTLTLGVQQLPFDLAGTTWTEKKEQWADAVMDCFYRYAPNIKDHILNRVVITPEDLDTDYLITGGNIFHGQMFLNQLFDSRPLPAMSSYRTPIAGYYLCGVGTHPGGGVMGASGHNAAQVVLSDLSGDKPTPNSPRSRSRKGVIDRVMANPLGARVGYELAKQPALRSITRRSTRGVSGKGESRQK